MEQEKPFWLRGLLDVRVARGGRAPSWTDGGPGKARYGGRSTSRGFERVTRPSLSQLALEAGATLPWGMVARAQLNWATDIDDDDRPLLIEAFLRKEWGGWEKGWGVQAGVMNPPLSLEHTGPAWTPHYTVLGDTVNVASRLQGLTKEYGVPLLLSGSTYAQVSAVFPCRLLGKVAVRGRQQETALYTVAL